MLEKHCKILERLREHGVRIYKFNDGPADPQAWEKIIGRYKLPFSFSAEKLLHGEELGIGDEHLKLRCKSS